MNEELIAQKTAKQKRVTVDLTAAAANEVERLRGVTGLTTADVFRHALTLFRIYVSAKAAGSDVLIVNDSEPNKRTSIELPVEIDKPK